MAIDPLQVGFCDAARCGAASLPPGERRQAAAIRNPRRRRQYVASRWLLRVHMARHLGRAPETLTFRHDDNGPPRLADGGMWLGLSHSGDLCMCVSVPDSLAAVGCDVERARPRPRARQIAEHYFHASEAAALAVGGVPEDFYRLWTLKEASHKARGRGLDAGLQRPAFKLRPSLRCMLAPDAARWRFASASLGLRDARYVVALAAAGRVAAGAVSACYYEQAPGDIRRERWSLDWLFACAPAGLDA